VPGAQKFKGFLPIHLSLVQNKILIDYSLKEWKDFISYSKTCWM